MPFLAVPRLLGEEQGDGGDDDGAAEEGGEAEPLAQDQRAERDGHDRVDVGVGGYRSWWQPPQCDHVAGQGEQRPRADQVGQRGQ